MNVTQVNVYIVETGSYRPPVVELVTDAGITGIGEAAVGFGAGCYGAAAMIRDLAQRYVLGEDPRNVNAIWSEFYFHSFWGKGGGTIFYAAVSALEQAMWDIKGKDLGVPVYELFGGRQRDRLHIYANDWADSGYESIEALARRASEVVADGYDALKMYPLNQPDEKKVNYHLKNREVTREMERTTIAAVAAVRQAIGPKVDLMVDMTAEGSMDTMTRIGRGLEPFDLMWYEEPVDAMDVDGHHILREKVNIPIAAGERLCTRYGFRRLLETRGVDIVQPDPGICGGLREMWAIANMAEAYDIRFAPHNCGGPVLTAAAVQMAACTSNFVILETYPYRPDIHFDIVENAFERQIKNSYLDVPTAPGLGVTLNHKTVDPFRVAHLTL